MQNCESEKLKGHLQAVNQACLTFTRGFLFFSRKKNRANVGEDVGVLESALVDIKKKKSAALGEPLAKHTAALQTLSQRAADCRRPRGSLLTAEALR